MKINKIKSALMKLDKKPNQDPDFRGYPYTNSYRYLGTIINASFSLEPHYKVALRKINYITHQLRCITLQGHFKLNNCLFKVLILPQFRLILSLSRFTSSKQLASIQVRLRQAYRAFNSLPRSTPIQFITQMIGKIEDMASLVENHGSIKLLARRQYRPLKQQELKEMITQKQQLKTAKVLPNDLRKLIQICYSNKCTGCNIIATVSHLVNFHSPTHRPLQHKLLDLVQKLQSPKSKGSAKSDLKRYIAIAKGITTKN